MSKKRKLDSGTSLAHDLRNRITPQLEDYDLIAEIGKGAFGVVYRVRKRNDPALPDLALKVMPLKVVTEPFGATVADFRRRADLVAQFSRHDRHRSYLDVYQFLFTERDVFIWDELCLGGDLFDRVVATPDGHLNERDAREVARSLCSVVDYLHGYGVIHRDIKPSNCFYARPGLPAGDLMLLDLSCGVDMATPSSRFYQLTGTPGYLSPEMAQGTGYGFQTDSYALGITLYEVSPFPVIDDQNDQEYLDMVNKPVVFPAKYWHSFSRTARELVRGLLEVDPERRLTPKEALEHPWLQDDWDLVRPIFRSNSSSASSAVSEELFSLVDRSSVASRRPRWSHLSLTSPSERSSEAESLDLAGAMKNASILSSR